MTSEEKTELQRVAARYEKYGVTFLELLRLVNTAPKDYSFRKALNGVRLALGLEYGERELFSTAEAREILECTDEELADMIKENDIEEFKISFL